MFQPITTQTGDDQYAGEYFLAKLKAHIASGKELKITLIGHSAGSIAISHLVEAVKARYNNLTFSQLFFLAPACRVDLFQKHIEPVIGSTISSFRMFTMKVEREKQDHCVPVIYTRSLLYMISGLFEVDKNGNQDIDAKIMGLREQSEAIDRYENFSELKQLKSFLEASPNRVVLSDDINSPDFKFRSTALKHGDFDNDEVTLTAIKMAL